LLASRLSFDAPTIAKQAKIVEEILIAELDELSEEKEIEAAIISLLETEHLPWQHMRDTGPRKYDLRTLINDLWLIDWSPGYSNIGMRLRCGSQGSGRPEQVAAALGFKEYPQSIHRTKLILETS